MTTSDVGPDQFVCEMCGGTFDKEWSDEVARAEATANGIDPDEPCGLVCDECYRLTPWGMEPLKIAPADLDFLKVIHVHRQNVCLAFAVPGELLGLSPLAGAYHACIQAEQIRQYTDRLLEQWIAVDWQRWLECLVAEFERTTLEKEIAALEERRWTTYVSESVGPRGDGIEGVFVHYA